MAFDNKDYEPVKARKKRFYETFPDGRITVRLVNEDVKTHALIVAAVFMNANDQEKNLPRAVGYALEIRDTELQTTNSGKKYESVNFSSWVENCEESAVGRALDNAGFASNMKCSAEEMAKAERMKKTLAPKPANTQTASSVPNPIAPTPFKAPKTHQDDDFGPQVTGSAPAPVNAPEKSTSKELEGAKDSPILPETIKSVMAVVSERKIKPAKVREIIQMNWGEGRDLKSLSENEAQKLLHTLSSLT
jgi:hypothetical protein